MSSKLFVISGPSGVGKDSLMALIFKHKPNILRWVTCTTRPPRKGEVEGVDYFFKTREEFELMIENDELVEWNNFADNYYGTPKSFVIDALTKGKSIITAIDVHGAENVKKAFPEACLLFIEPPSLAELRSRLIKRGTEKMEHIEKRLSVVDSEIDKKGIYDKAFINDNLEQTAQEILDYISECN